MITIQKPGYAWGIAYGSWGAIPAQGTQPTALDNTSSIVLRNMVTGVIVHSIDSGGTHEPTHAAAWSIGGGGRQDAGELTPGSYECLVEGRTAGQFSCDIWTAS